MTRDGEIAVLREHLTTCARLETGLARSRGRIDTLVPITSEGMRALEDDAHINILAFLKTYEQFEETLGRTLKVIVMLMYFGKQQRMTPRDVANRAVALGIFSDGATWADAVRVRNELAHEYPLHPGKQAEQVNSAWDKSDTLIDAHAAIKAFVAREGLLDGLL